MFVFFGCVLLLILGYFTYGKIVEKIFGIDENRPTPASTHKDGVDYIEMPTWKVFMIQLLDIAGIGPIFGPILGALYGPVALLWVVFGSIFAGGVHDFFSGMLSVRNKGHNIPEIVGDALGTSARQIMRVFSVLLLLFVGVVFILSPAKLLNDLTHVNVDLFIAVILCYYFVATILPIDKIIGRIYPFFGALLLFMTFGIAGGLIFRGYDILPNLNFMVNTNPAGKPIWPLLFVTISCGALSGFHSTQSPLMSRCIKNERYGRKVFYGAMICEGIIGLIWVTVGLSFYKSPEALNSVITAQTPAGVVYEASRTLLGNIGGTLAILGVIILPITSGDTAFRSTRLIISEAFKIDQKKISKRLIIAVPLFVVGFLISTQKFGVIWRYFGWANQTLATMVLWATAIYLASKNKFHWIATLPAAFMTAVVVAFILEEKIGFGLAPVPSRVIGITFALLTLGVFLIKHKVWGHRTLSE